MLTPYKIEDYFKEFHPIWAVKMKDVRQKMYWSHLSIPFIDWLRRLGLTTKRTLNRMQRLTLPTIGESNYRWQ
jgi:hypothetical protein